MENATKFLVIAGAILIVIVLISVALVIVNAGQSQIDQGMDIMDATGKQMFNQKFTTYDGNQKGTNVKALIDAVITSNNQNYATESRQISLTFENVEGVGNNAFENPIVMEENSADAANTFATEARKAKRSINTGATYTVDVATNATTGLVDAITITKDIIE